MHAASHTNREAPLYTLTLVDAMEQFLYPERARVGVQRAGAAPRKTFFFFACSELRPANSPGAQRFYYKLASELAGEFARQRELSHHPAHRETFFACSELRPAVVRTSFKGLRSCSAR